MNNLQFQLCECPTIELGGDLPRLEREMLRARDLERNYPVTVYSDLEEASAVDFMLWLLTLGSEKRDEVLMKFAPELEELATKRRETYRKAKRQLKALSGHQAG